MNNKEIIEVVEVVSNEKELDPEVMFEAIELALAVTRKKLENDAWLVRVDVDRKTGDYKSYRQWLVVDDDEFITDNSGHEICCSDANVINAGLSVGEYYEELLEPIDYGRISSQIARQVILQKVREAERRKIVESFEPLVGTAVSGVVKRVEKGNVIVDLGGGALGLLNRSELIPREHFRSGDRVRSLLSGVSSAVKGPQLLLSRRAPELLVELFLREVPEAAEGIIEIVGAARDPGVRAKVSVLSHDHRVDPIGSCVGMHGTRVQSVSNDLGGERIDIVVFDDNPAQFVINALSPARVCSIVVDEESHSMDVAVDEEVLSQAIGRGGENVRLASQLTGWELNIMTEQEALEKNQNEAEALVALFVEQLEVDEDLSIILVEEGFSTIEEVAFVPISEMLDIENFDRELVDELRKRAHDVLLTREISNEEKMEAREPEQELLEMEGMDKRLAYLLAANNIVSLDDLAELAIDELLEIDELEEERAGQLIMTARASWFDGDQ